MVLADRDTRASLFDASNQAEVDARVPNNAAEPDRIIEPFSQLVSLARLSARLLCLNAKIR